MEREHGPWRQRFQRNPNIAGFPRADKGLVVWGSDEAGDHQLPHAAPGEGRAVLRAHLRADQRLGVLLRQVQEDPLQGRLLRPLRRGGGAREGQARAHGTHIPRRAGGAHLVLQRNPQPARTAARPVPAKPRPRPVLRAVPRDRRGRRLHLGAHRQDERRP